MDQFHEPFRHIRHLFLRDQLHLTEAVQEINSALIKILRERLEILKNRPYEICNDKKPHIGLDNVRQRLAFMYHDQFQFDIQSTPGYGTTISITIPLVR